MYRATYKCRLCGDVYYTGAVAGDRPALINLSQISAGVRVYDPQAPQLLEIHHCGGAHAGSLGLADFQGWERDAEA